MCILFIYRNPDANSESYRLILASNRDEDIKRPASLAHYWKNHPECLGGTDMTPGKEGGTWLALSLTGKAGVILNLCNEEDSPNTQKKGRGFLIPQFVTSNDSAISYLPKLHKENQNGQPYNPYALVLINLHNANVDYLSSSMRSTGPFSCEDAVLGFSNSGFGIPYKKVEEGKEKFKNIVTNVKVRNQAELIENLLKFLKSKERYLPDAELQKRSPKMYEELSSIFVSLNNDYGTRSHSVLLVTGSGKITFIEETLMPDLTWKRQIFNNNLMPRNN
ncbi:transport and Golgi organization 2 homolog [Hylaeus volcanicus]|uniref:transport and Golgi organization 2 homolog n=1 Tax=Hylaeus volcanicus TaxID=313075 RepID=UPI0023B79575|nr:transport and Golgi organization 2 homolog [Hylaeus volcanicus]